MRRNIIRLCLATVLSLVESRDDSYLHMAGHFVSNADFIVVKEVGRDFLPQNRHPMDVTPLCDALS
jgi:hypothetical protein